eukprot:scaffold191739_cov45-Prasinocladus_malaysianus.AAC.3
MGVVQINGRVVYLEGLQEAGYRVEVDVHGPCALAVDDGVPPPVGPQLRLVDQLELALHRHTLVDVPELKEGRLDSHAGLEDVSSCADVMSLQNKQIWKANCSQWSNGSKGLLFAP